MEQWQIKDAYKKMINEEIIHESVYKSNNKNKSTIDFSVDGFQRSMHAWKESSQESLIRTILKGLPMPSIVLWDKGEKISVIDGQQRLQTIRRFFENQLKISNEEGLKDYFNASEEQVYSNLIDKAGFDKYKLTCMIIEDLTDTSLAKHLFINMNKNFVKLKNHEIREADATTRPGNQNNKKMIELAAFFKNDSKKLRVPSARSKEKFESSVLAREFLYKLYLFHYANFSFLPETDKSLTIRYQTDISEESLKNFKKDLKEFLTYYELPKDKKRNKEFLSSMYIQIYFKLYKDFGQQIGNKIKIFWNKIEEKNQDGGFKYDNDRKDIMLRSSIQHKPKQLAYQTIKKLIEG